MCGAWGLPITYHGHLRPGEVTCGLPELAQAVASANRCSQQNSSHELQGCLGHC